MISLGLEIGIKLLYANENAIIKVVKIDLSGCKEGSNVRLVNGNDGNLERKIDKERKKSV